MELKTLKDLKFEDKLGGSYIIKTDKLKQLAINWIKEEIKIWDSRHPLSTKGKTSDVPVIMRWMDRFNINEEDLKDGKRKS